MKIFKNTKLLVVFSLSLFVGAVILARHDSNPITLPDNILGVDISALEGPHIIDVTGTEDGEDINAQFVLDGAGNLKTMVTTVEGGVEFVLFDGDTYVKTNDANQWLRFPAGTQGVPTIDIDELTFNQKDIDGITASGEITDRGRLSCNSGMCRAYEDFGETEIAVILVDAMTNRLTTVLIEQIEGSDSLNISYNYESNAKVTIPKDFQNFE